MVNFVCCGSHHDSDNNVNDFAVKKRKLEVINTMDSSKDIDKASRGCFPTNICKALVILFLKGRSERCDVLCPDFYWASQPLHIFPSFESTNTV